MAPVRARIPSSNVVLPLWNGPTSAMHRGPVARVPFCAISASQTTEMRSSAGPFAHRFRPEGDLARGASVWRTTAEPGWTCALCMPTKRPPRRPSMHRAQLAQPSGAGAQMQFRHAEGEIEPDRGLYRDRLQRDRVVGTADENVGAEAGGDRHLTGRAEIIAGEKGGTRGREAVREHRPNHHGAAGGADIEPELADRSAIDLLWAGRLWRERAHDSLLRAEDEADAGRDVASQYAGPHSLGGGGIGGRNN